MSSVNMRVILAKADPARCEDLRLAFERGGDVTVVGAVADGAGLARSLPTLQPDALLIEAGLPDCRVPDFIRRARLLLPSLHVLVSFADDQMEDAGEFLAAGAQACLVRRAAPSEFLHALRAIAEGGIYLSRALAGVILLAHRKGNGADLYGLTDREAEVLNFIGAGFSNKEIARRLMLSVRTVETHRLNIRRKTGAARLRDLVCAARQLGLDPVPAEALASSPPALRHLRSV